MRGLTPALPTSERVDPGVEDPIPTFPLAKIVRNEVPDDDATLNGLVAGDPWTLKVKEEDVAFTPATVPLSWKSPVDNVVGDVHLASNPFTPPERDEIPRDDVDVQIVEVPVERSTCPFVPLALVESLRNPERLRLVP